MLGHQSRTTTAMPDLHRNKDFSVVFILCRVSSKSVRMKGFMGFQKNTFQKIVTTTPSSRWVFIIGTTPPQDDIFPLTTDNSLLETENYSFILTTVSP